MNLPLRFPATFRLPSMPTNASHVEHRPAIPQEKNGLYPPNKLSRIPLYLSIYTSFP
jgi:hypothetical protein